MTAREALDRTALLLRDAVTDEVSEAAIVDRLQSFRVRCISDWANASTHSGQSALVTLVSLIARMGVQVAIDVPDIELVGPQPPLRGNRLSAALVDLGDDLVPGSSIVCEGGTTSDLTFVFGDTPAGNVTRGWRVAGKEWAGEISEIDTPCARWEASGPIGGLTAAALAASEVFKTAVQSLPLRHPAWAERLAPCRSAMWDFHGEGLALPAGPVAIDIISAGAITQAALFVLLRLPLMLAGRLFDSDVADLSNVNRQMLFRRSESGLKVNIVSRTLTSLYSCIPVPERFTLPTSTPHMPLAPHVLVGVDDIPARWDVQRAAEAWVGIGGTTHFEGSISSHEPHQPCAGCLHPADDPQGGPIPTVSFVSFWAGLALAVRFLRHIGSVPYDSKQQHLWLSPLRMDKGNAALWRPVSPRLDCPVACEASRRLLLP